MNSDMRDALDAAWAQHEQTLREYQLWLRERHPEWFKYRRDAVPKTSEMVQSKFLRKEDIDDDTRVTIKGVKLEDMGQQGAQEQRWVVYFREFPKGMVLNVTTIRVLEAAFGDDTDQWIGKPCLLYVDPNVSFQGRVVGGLRIRTPRKKVEEKAAAVAHEDFDDDVPF